MFLGKEIATCSIALLLLISIIYPNPGLAREVGSVVDEFNGVKVYYNGKINSVHGRNVTKDFYNLGLRYQCVEFVKRYYLEYYGHKMLETYGHAKDFFDRRIADGGFNRQRGLLQYTNESRSKPETGDILVFGPSASNPYGHVGVVSLVSRQDSLLEIVQQNAGYHARSRARFQLDYDGGKWTVQNARALGWLRLPEVGSKQ